MSDDRPEKRVIRRLWLETLVEFDEAYTDDSVPLYLTLSGAEGKDIALLAEHNLLRLTETGAVASEHRHRVVAIEHDSQAVIELQRRFPGLKILEYEVKNLVRSETLIRFPDGEHEKFCCARVVNLDLNQALSPTDDMEELTFPVLQWIAKLGQLHFTKKLDWCLCFTLHGDINWPIEISSAVQDFLAENFEMEPEFGEACRALLGNDLYDAIVATRAVDLAHLSTDQQQQILMIFVPKKIASLLCPQGWRVETQHNLRYGGGSRAPMVTWIMNCVRDSRATRRPNLLYRESLRAALTGVGKIAEDGSIS